MAEELLGVATEAFARQQGGLDAVQQQLVGMFTDGLAHEYLKLRVIRDDPQNLRDAVGSAQAEQNVRARLSARSGNQQFHSRSEEPMEIDHSRFQGNCMQCGRKGHKARECRSKRVQEVQQKTQLVGTKWREQEMEGSSKATTFGKLLTPGHHEDGSQGKAILTHTINLARSPWAFPIVVVDKKDGSKRFCVDFRRLNKVSKIVSYPLPLIDDILTQLGGAKYFTSLDLKSGYWQVKVDEGDKEKTAFTCHKRLFEFNAMPFGLSNAPGVFQELMSIVLQDCGHFALAYLDDVLIHSKTLKDHLMHIQFEVKGASGKIETIKVPVSKNGNQLFGCHHQSGRHKTRAE